MPGIQSSWATLLIQVQSLDLESAHVYFLVRVLVDWDKRNDSDCKDVPSH